MRGFCGPSMILRSHVFGLLRRPVWVSAAFAVGLASTLASPPAAPNGDELVLVFADEFDGAQLDATHWLSQQYTDGLKRETARGPDNLEVRDGELRLYVRREARPAGGKRVSTWTAGYVYTRETVEPNTYVEARFKAGAASGVNNAFWLACVSNVPTDGIRDRYEIDVVETRLDVRPEQPIGLAHLAWHDWKTFAYARNAKGERDHVAQGTHVNHSWDDYHVWGVWLGEREIIYYLNGREVWRGDQHPRLTHQWHTGVGKFDRWFPDREREAYGRHGQEDWSYFGGLAGDRMNVIFSNLPWPEKWTPLTDEANGSYMAVDYVRIYRPRRVLQSTPAQRVLSEPMALAPHDAEVVPLDAVDLTGSEPTYFAFTTSGDTAALRCEFIDAQGRTLFHVGGTAGELVAGFERQVSTSTAYPARERSKQWRATSREQRWLVRYTPPLADGAGASVSVIRLGVEDVPAREPFFHANIDASGNTSANNGWHLNARGGAPAAPVAALRLRNDGTAPASVRDVAVGLGFRSVRGQGSD